jgi:hypothetical protein
LVGIGIMEQSGNGADATGVNYQEFHWLM